MKEGNYMKTWKKVTLGTVALGSAALLAACGNSGSSSSSSSKDIQWNLTSPIQTLDSSLATDTYSNIIIGNTNAGLTRVDKDGKAQPELAKSVDVSKDGLTYTFHLRDGLKWSNGDALIAKDFVYSWQRAVDPATASEYGYLLGPVKNANEINGGKADKSTLGVKATDDKTFVVTLAQPTPYFEFLTANSVYFPLNQKVVEKYGKQYGTSSEKMVYSGPYKFEKSKGWNGSNQTFSIVKNDDYWDKSAVKTKEIDFQVVQDVKTSFNLYKQGKIDQTGIGDPDLYKANKTDKNVVSLNEATTSYVQYNQSGKNKALANKDIREAFNLATDRKQYVDTVTPASTPATGLTPAGMAKTNTGEDFAKYAEQPYKYDATAAKAAWEKGLKEIGETKLTLTLTTDDTQAAKDSATFLKQAWEEKLPGLTLNIKSVPFKQRLNDSTTGNFDMVISLWGGDYAEPSTFLDLFTSTSPNNNGKINNVTYDKAIKAAEVTDALDPEKHYADYKAAEEALYTESNINPLYFRTSPVLRNPNLKDVRFGSTGLTYDFKTAYLK